jgi:hypothetical protein
VGKVFSDFKKWTKKMSKNENPKKLCPKKMKNKNWGNFKNEKWKK